MEPRRDMWMDSALTQEHIPESIAEGSTLQLDRDEGYDERFVSPLYIRSHLIQRQEFFNAFIGNQEKQQLFVAGPPGSGKTVFLSLLARMYAKNQRKKVLYVAYRHGNRCPIIVFDCDSVKQIAKFPTSRKLYDFLEELLERDPQHYDLVLYDGVRQSIRDSSSVMALFKGRDSGVSKVVFVTSLAFRIKDGDTQPAYMREYSKDYFDSWTKEEHLEAMCRIYEAGILPEAIQQDITKLAKTRAFSDQNEGTEEKRDSSAVDDAEPQDALSHEQILSYVDYKYFYAGGSARFMIEYAIDLLQTTLTDLCESVLNNEQWKAFSTCHIPTGTVDAVNTLMQRFRGRDDVARCAPVSRYIAMVAYDHVGGELVEAVKAVASNTDNPSLQGWAFELEQLGDYQKGSSNPL